MLRHLFPFPLLIAGMVACSDVHAPLLLPPMPEEVNILALGDSYTKGQGIPFEQNFPNQLVDSLAAQGIQMLGLHVIAQSGWRTDQLLAAVGADTTVQDSVFSLVTLCIGVNNQYQRRDTAVYRNEFESLLRMALHFAGERPARVLVLSIPDWAYTPYGQQFSNPAGISAEIDAFNRINQAIAEQYEVTYIDVTGISRLWPAQPAWVAADKLHPSAAQYTRWVEVMLPQIRW